MNNILSFIEFNGQELEQVVYDQELNEGLRQFFNKRAGIKVRAELSEEIEMSKTVMEGIKEGLDSLNSDFDILRDELSKSDTNKKNEKQKALDGIMKIIEDSRKNTWDINELIDEGEIDYTGFTANVGIASVTYFGILFSPFRSVVMIHKGYSYFFNIIKNTIRKALVMLQLNFDQFENLIITKGFQSLDYLQDQDTSVKVSEFYGKLYDKLFDPKMGMMKGKRGSEIAKQQMQFAKNQIDAMMKADKSRKLSDNAYNCLDQYNNTYTRSLETLRQYTQDDVQKNLDSIKTSMNKLAGQDPDLQAYGELLIAAAEEHAYKVSSSIYNKFAKMTEAFSLPNQKKLIDLIQAATKEQMDAAEKETTEKKEAADLQEKEESAKKLEKDGLEIFNSVDGAKIGKLDEETNKYKDIEAKSWTYKEFKELPDDKKDIFESWLTLHTEVLKECDDTLKVAFVTTEGDGNSYIDYVDSLVDYIGPCIVDDIKESYILNFDQYLMEEAEESGEEIEDGTEDSDVDEEEKKEEKTDKSPDKSKSKSKSKKIYIDFDNINDNQKKDLKELYSDERVAKVALDVIGSRLLKDKSFVKNRETIVNLINKGLDLIDDDSKESKKIIIKSVTYNILSESIKKLKELRDHDYVNVEKSEK